MNASRAGEPRRVKGRVNPFCAYGHDLRLPDAVLVGKCRLCVQAQRDGIKLQRVEQPVVCRNRHVSRTVWRGGKMRCEQCYRDDLERRRAAKEKQKPPPKPKNRDEAFTAGEIAYLQRLQERASAWNPNTLAWEKREAAEELARFLARHEQQQAAAH